MTSPESEQPEKRLPITTASGEDMRLDQADTLSRRFGDVAKYSLIALVMIFAFWVLNKKLAAMSWHDIRNALSAIPTQNILLALLLTAANFCLLTGYDWIAVRYLRKPISVSRVAIGAVIGYAFSNIFGWMLSGTLVRYRLYRRWGFSPVEILAFVTILSITFWLGMFLLAGIAFTSLPVKLPEDAEGLLMLDHHIWGWIFLAVVGLYLLASALIRKPIKWKSYRYALPPLQLSVMQLLVSAGDFVITSSVLYVLLPANLTGPDAINFSTVLIAYLTAMIMVVVTHVPGGVGVLEAVLLSMLPEPARTPILAATLMFRVIYYLIPGAIAGVLYIIVETRWKLLKKKQNSVPPPASVT